MVLEKTLESPLDCKESQPVHSKGDQPGISLEGMLKLKLQYFGHLMRRVDSLDLEKEMATHFSILAWEIPWTEEPGGLRSMGSQNSWTQLTV